MSTGHVDPNRVAAYIRWSTEEQGQGTTLAVQRQALELFIRSQGWAFREDLLFVDDGYSGGNLDRPGLGRLRAAVRDGCVECVVVYKLDRLSRSVVDTVNLVLREWEGRCHLKSAREPIDTTAPAGKVFFYMLVSYAEFERSTIRERTLSGKHKRAEQGRNAGHRYNYGYRKGTGGAWELNGWDARRQCFTGPAAVVRRIFDDYLAGHGTTQIAARLRAAGIPGIRGGAWRCGTIHAILNNPTYAGIYTYGQRAGTRPGDGGPGVRQNGDGRFPGPPHHVDGAIPAIITRAEWERVQQLLQDRGRRPPRVLGSPYLLTGVATCARCGGGLCGAASRSGRRRKRYYTCANRLQGGCPLAAVDADQLEQIVLDRVRETVQDPVRDTLASATLPSVHSEWVAAELRQHAAALEHAVTAGTTALAAAQRKEQKLAADYLAGRIDAAVFNRLLPAVQAEVQAAAAQLARARERLQATSHLAADRLAGSNPVAGDPATGDRAVTAVHLEQVVAAVDVLGEMSTAECKQFLRDVVASLQVWQERRPRGRGAPRRNPNPLRVQLQLRTGNGPPGGTVLAAAYRRAVTRVLASGAGTPAPDHHHCGPE